MSALPEGILCFLFTDVEGSTRNWEERRHAMSAALTRHDELARGAIEQHHGKVFKTVGDAFHAVFERASDAIAAAVAFQRALADEDWAAIDPECPALRARVGLHSGVAEQRDGDYFGPPLNRCARIEAAGHGGQILCSEAVRLLARDSLPDGVRFRSLGEHRLKDLGEPERLHQVIADGLRVEFPAPRTLNARPTNLPQIRTSLLGREADLARVTAALCAPDASVVTLTGPGGTGKTRLAVAAAAANREAFPDGVFFVDLAPLTDPDLVVSRVSTTLGLCESPPEPLAVTLSTHLQGKSLLLVLDNFEHVVEAAPGVQAALNHAPEVRILATSRVPLRLRAEVELPLDPLSVPTLDAAPSLSAAGASPAVQLFVERAARVRPDFVLDEGNVEHVTRICARLDGLPLAIELAAARCRLLTPAVLLRRLDRRLPLLVGGARDAPERQRTLRDAIAWSYDLLSAEQALLFRRLGVFRGGFGIEAAEAIVGRDGVSDVVEALDGLCASSLISSREGPRGELRFTMLETIREFAVDTLTDAGEEGTVRRRHLCWYAALVEAFEEEVYRTGVETDWLERLEAEQANVRSAFEWGIHHQPAERRTAAELASNLGRWWYNRALYSEGRSVLDTALALPEAEDPALGPRLRYVRAWMSLPDSSIDVLERCVIDFRALGDAVRTGWALNDLGLCRLMQGEVHAARALLEESLSLKSRHSSDWDVAVTQFNLGEVAHVEGDLDEAERLYRSSLDRMAHTEIHSWRAEVLKDLGNLLRLRGRTDEARAALIGAVRSAHQAGNRYVAAKALLGLGGLRLDAGEPLIAARLFATGERLLSQCANELEPIDAEPYERDRAALCRVLERDRLDTAWAEGSVRTFDEVVAEMAGSWGGD